MSCLESLPKEYHLLPFHEYFAKTIPISALKGDNIIAPSERTPWYQGPSLMHHLEHVEITDNAMNKPFRMRVQWVNRPNLDFRGFSGTIASGVVKPGDSVVVPSSGQISKVARIVTMDGDLEEVIESRNGWLGMGLYLSV